MTERPKGSGGVCCTPRMSFLIAQAGSGVLSTFEGGQELRGLYNRASIQLNPELLNEFARLCYLGDLVGIQNAVETGKAPALTGTETPLKLGYATLVVTGSQRLSLPDHYRFLHLATLEFLLEHGCPPDVLDISRHTALSHATEIPEDNADLARMLIAHGANVNHPDIYGMTPIFQAVMAAHSKAVDVLMEGGADLDITDADGSRIRDTYIRCGPKVAAAIHTWERRRAGEKVPLGEKGCGLCGKDGKLLFCSACHSIRYCSSECQRSDWKKHKQSCKRFSASNTVTVKPRYEGLTSLIPMQHIARAVSGFPTPPISELVKQGQPQEPTTEYPKKKIIKVQIPKIPSRDGPMMVYDAKREFLCSLLRDDAPAAFDRLTELVQSKGTFGLKAYLAADLRSKDELVIKIDEVLAEQPF